MKNTGKIKIARYITVIILSLTMTLNMTILSACSKKNEETTIKVDNSDAIVLRVCNWEEYIDLGDWDDDELIELENGKKIIGVNPIYKDFEKWYFEQYGKKVKVEYSCAGTNEDLYNQLTMGDSYDLICPSEYMIMKLMAEDWLEPYSDDFFDDSNKNNYYSKGVSPYIRNVFESNSTSKGTWSQYAACYMWGITGILYNPEQMTKEEASTWQVFNNKKFSRKITLKDNVRDTYFATLGILKRDELISEKLRNDPDYNKKLAAIMNDVDKKTIDEIEPLLQEIMGNIYALETDSGKADMITGKIVANYQWSGDAVYAMDQAEEDDVYLKFAVPEECTNLWFDGWVMLKDGIDGNADKKQAAEAFVNYLSMPENVVRNMYYIGYTSSIVGEAGDDTIFDYVKWCYGAEENEEDTIEYPLGYFFSGNNKDKEYIISTTSDQIDRQLYTQYPSEEVINRAAAMGYFDAKENKNINQMWINARCFNIKEVPAIVWIVIILVIVCSASAIVYHKRKWKI